MVYQVPASKASLKQNQFEFHMPGEKKIYRVPKLKYIKPALVEQLDGKEPMEIVRGLMDNYHPGMFDKFGEFEQILDFYNAWAAESGLSLGESEASPE